MFWVLVFLASYPPLLYALECHVTSTAGGLTCKGTFCTRRVILGPDPGKRRIDLFCSDQRFIASDRICSYSTDFNFIPVATDGTANNLGRFFCQCDTAQSCTDIAEEPSPPPPTIMCVRQSPADTSPTCRGNFCWIKRGHASGAVAVVEKGCGIGIPESFGSVPLTSDPVSISSFCTVKNGLEWCYCITENCNQNDAFSVNYLTADSCCADAKCETSCTGSYCITETTKDKNSDRYLDVRTCLSSSVGVRSRCIHTVQYDEVFQGLVDRYLLVCQGKWCNNHKQGTPPPECVGGVPGSSHRQGGLASRNTGAQFQATLLLLTFVVILVGTFAETNWM